MFEQVSLSARSIAPARGWSQRPMIQRKCAGCDSGEGACAACQAKLNVSQPNDPLEREADAVADRVMGMTTPAPGPAPRAAGQNQVMPKRESASAGQAAPLFSRQGGRPLDAGARGFLEPRLGADLGGVRVHTDAAAARSAQQLAAQAFTVGSDIYFGSGRYQPGTQSGRRLLAHELVHVTQQGAASTRVFRTPARPHHHAHRESPCPPPPSGASTIQSIDVDVGTGTMQLTWNGAAGGPDVTTSHEVTIGAGNCGIDCNDPKENISESHCTPMGDFTMGGTTAHLSDDASATFVRWIVVPHRSGIAIHSYPELPRYPHSHGCVRNTVAAAKLVFCYATVGTPIHIGGTWSPGPGCWKHGRWTARPKHHADAPTTMPPATTPPPTTTTPPPRPNT